MKRTVSAVLSAALAALVLCGTVLTAAAPAEAQGKRKSGVSSSRKRTASKRVRAKARRTSYSSDAAKRAAAMKKLNDYNYVKSMSPYRGSAYKWGSPW